MTTDGFDPLAFHADLVKHGIIVPGRVQGIFGRTAVFEDVLARTNDLITRLASGDGAKVLLYPPVIERRILETSEFLDSFPQLAGSVFSFFGNDAQHRELSARIHDGKPWGDLQGLTDVVLNPAACYPVYPTFTGVAPAAGHLVDMQNWVFRHEPSPEPTRMQAFRVREFVRVGSPDMVVDWRNMWLDRGVNLLRSLELPAVPDVASDPFFGRGGRMLASAQKEQRLKFEVQIPVISQENPTAVCSFNYHQDHFGRLFEIQTSDGAVAHTACLGFGLERIVMALFKTHGFAPAAWPKAARDQLWP